MLESGDVALWYLPTSEVTDAAVNKALVLMTETERKKHRAFHFDKHRHEYAVTRLVERFTLSQCTGRKAEELRFFRDASDRPHLENANGLVYNLSNSVTFLVCVAARDREVGVDVEPVARASDILEIADSVFSARELADLASLSDALKEERAVLLWTLKEAYIKARGKGLALPLEKFWFWFDSGPHTGDARYDGATIRFHVEPELQDTASRWLYWTEVIDGHRVSICAEKKSDELNVRAMHLRV